MPPPFLTMEEAVQDLEVFGLDTAEMADVQRQVQAASDIVWDWCTVPERDTWTEITAPGRVKAATRLVLRELYDDPEQERDPLTEGAKNILRRLRDPALA